MGWRVGDRDGDDAVGEVEGEREGARVVGAGVDPTQHLIWELPGQYPETVAVVQLATSMHTPAPTVPPPEGAAVATKGFSVE